MKNKVMDNVALLSDMIAVTVEPYFIEQRAVENQQHYVYGYHVTITNNSTQTVQLLRRHWVITDSDGGQIEVEGEGVVGLQPTLAPNQNFQYSSGTSFKTPVGTMHGEYTLINNQQQTFSVAIAPFRLADSTIIH